MAPRPQTGAGVQRAARRHVGTAVVHRSSLGGANDPNQARDGLGWHWKVVRNAGTTVEVGPAVAVLVQKALTSPLRR
jgi:hypothetical protein